MFFRLEKFVNLNYTGFHKILKKHDRRLPHPCKEFYMARLRDQSWVKGDCSDVIVSLSKNFGALRGDDEPEAKDTEKQVSFHEINVFEIVVLIAHRLSLDLLENIGST